MKKNVYLSPKEQQIFPVIKERDVISNEDIKQLFPHMQAVNKVIHSLLQKGYLYQLKKGYYLVCEDREPAIQRPMVVANALFDGYIAFSSALQIYNLLDYEPFTIFSATMEESKTLSVGNYEFRAIAIGDKMIGHTFYNDVYVSSLEKTFFDCFYKPRICSYADTTKALFQTTVKWEKLVSYFKTFGTSALCQRTGYVLETLEEETGYSVPDSVINYFASRVKNTTRLLPSGSRSSTYSRKWKVQDNVGIINLLGWWYYG